MQRGWLYVIRLKEDNYYVGITGNLSQRFEDHWAGKGAAWTRKYPPIEVISVTPDKTGFDEDAKVKELMSDHGISKVRGGSYSRCELSKDQIRSLDYELKRRKGLCFKCNSPDHWIKDCPINNLIIPTVPKISGPIFIVRLSCSRCGSDDHTQDKCLLNFMKIL